MKKLGLVVLLLFALFWVISQPTSAAGSVRTAADALFAVFESLIQFVAALFG